MRIALGIEYDGTNYHGWQSQKQKNINCIQEIVERAISIIADHNISIIAAGRTDSGVHAFEQVVHFDTIAERSNYAWIFGTNSLLPQDIRIIWARQVTKNFHARYAAISRCYRYLIYNKKIFSALLYNRTMCCNRSILDDDLMQKAGKFLIGYHDFSSFRGSGCQSKTAYRNIIFLNINRQHDIISIDIEANSFLLHMVRNIVGSLIEIGYHKQNPEWIKYLLFIKNRSKAGITAPACGLYLLKVKYNEF